MGPIAIKSDFPKEFRHWITMAFRAPKYLIGWIRGFLCTRPLIWDFLNRAGQTFYEEHLPNLDRTQQQVVDGLVTDGIALTHLDELFPGKNPLSEMIQHAEVIHREAKEGVMKPFLQYFWGDVKGRGDCPIIDLDNPFIQISLHPRILDIVNSYMGLWSKLIYFELAETNLMNAGAVPLGSQRWHRDPAINRIVKVFIYLNDVDEESGPFMYVLQSKKGGRWGKMFLQKQFGWGGYYPPKEAVEKMVPKRDMMVCTGRAGTVVFCDTIGLHKGGYSISKKRSMFTSVFMAEGNKKKPMFQHSLDFKERIGSLKEVSRFAVS